MIQATSRPATFDLYRLGLRPYSLIWQAMRQFTVQRSASTADQLWLVEHHAVFTQGQAGHAEHLLQPGNIPVVQSDRGGQVTYHGPGQMIAYLLFDLRRLNIGVRSMVTALEQSVVDLLDRYAIHAFSRPDAPGVYVRIGSQAAKIASLGLRVRRGCSYHGIALNLDMDLDPFMRINPCGHAGMMMTQLRDLLATCDSIDRVAVSQHWLTCLTAQIKRQGAVVEPVPIIRQGEPFLFSCTR